MTMVTVRRRLFYLIILVVCLSTTEGLHECGKYEECVRHLPNCNSDYYNCLMKSCRCTGHKICTLAGEVYSCTHIPDYFNDSFY